MKGAVLATNAVDTRGKGQCLAWRCRVEDDDPTVGDDHKDACRGPAMVEQLLGDVREAHVVRPELRLRDLELRRSEPGGSVRCYWKWLLHPG